MLRRPDPGLAALLLCGEDPERVAQARAEVVDAWLGADAAAEMRLDRLAAADLRRDPAALGDAMGAVGFFPGPRAVWVEAATDGLAPVLGAALDGRRADDARLVVTAGSLTAKGALRKLFEGRRDCLALAFRDEPLAGEELDAMLAGAGLGAVDPDARAALTAIARGLSRGEMRGLAATLALHQAGDPAPLGAQAVRALAPAGEGDLDALLAAVTDGRRAEVAAGLARVWAEGTGAVAVAIALGRHLRALLAAATDPGGPQAGLSAQRPPVWGPRRDALLRAAPGWRRERIEAALEAALDLDLALRSASRAPERPAVERVLLRVAALRG